MKTVEVGTLHVNFRGIKFLQNWKKVVAQMFKNDGNFFPTFDLHLLFWLLIMCWSSNCDFVRFVASLSQKRGKGGDIYTIIFRFRFRTEVPIKASRGGYARSFSFRVQQCCWQEKKIKKPKHLFALAKGERNGTIVSTWRLGFK